MGWADGGFALQMGRSREQNTEGAEDSQSQQSNHQDRHKSSATIVGGNVRGCRDAGHGCL